MTEKEIDLPASPQLIVRVLPEKEAVRVDGLPGRVPSSYVWKSWKISARRHAQSALVDTRPPETLRNGSGSLVLALSDGVPGAGHVPPDDGGAEVAAGGALDTVALGIVGGGVGVVGGGAWVVA